MWSREGCGLVPAPKNKNKNGGWYSFEGLVKNMISPQQRLLYLGDNKVLTRLLRMVGVRVGMENEVSTRNKTCENRKVRLHSNQLTK